ncbi:hypothetical protein [Streptomyces sp. NPDC015130]|uniref:hypothetical protein n=1 Tax=Streptomyces sp. NPDC015130 TaxID=3364940 RepID=UPI0036FEF5AD
MRRGPGGNRMYRAAAAGALAATLLTASGCASSVDPIERLGRKAAERMGPEERDPAAERDVAATTVAEGAARTGTAASR